MNISADYFGNILSAVFGHLTSELSDANRPIRLRLPVQHLQLQDALLIQRISGRDTLCNGLNVELWCLSTSVHIPLKSFIALPIAIEMVTDRGELHQICGVITEASTGESDGGLATYKLHMQDALSLLTRRRNTRVFMDKSVLDISYILLDEWKNRSPLFASILQVDTSRITQEYPPISFTMQSGEDDRAFLFRLWKRWGISWFFEPIIDLFNETITHRLCLFDDVSRLSQNNAGTIKFQRESATELRDTITQFNGARTLVSSSVNYQQWQPTTAQTQLSNPFSHRDQGDTIASMNATLEDAVLETPASGLDESIVDRFGLLHIQRHEQQSKCFFGQGNVRDLQVGQWFELTGHAEIDTHPEAERQFVLSELWFEAENNLPKPVHERVKKLITTNNWQHNLKQSNPNTGFNDTDSNRYRNRFSAVRRGIPIIPAFNPIEDLPKVHPVIGVVVCPQGEEVHCDAWGRIQIRFPNTKAEDHVHSGGAGANDSEGDSAWIDLMSSWAGDQYGAIQLPRAGDTVIVNFLNGDPDRPYISGRMYHDQRQPPTFSNTGNLPDNKYISGIKSKEINGDRYNQLRLDDTPNQISAQLASQHGESQLNLGFLTLPRAKDGKGEARGQGLELRTDESGAIRASKGLLLTTHGQSNAQGQQMDVSPAKASLSNNLEQMKSLSDSAKHQNADPFSTLDKLKSCIDALEAQGDDAKVKAFKQAILLLASPSDIALTTPKNIHSHAGESITQSANESINQAAGKGYVLTAGQGISLYTVDHGAKLFAAKGKIQIQAQSDAMELIASLGLKIISTQDNVEISAAKNITLTAGGSQIKIGDGGITISSPSPINYKGSQHVFGGGASVNATMPFLPNSKVTDFSRQINYCFHYPKREDHHTTYYPPAIIVVLDKTKGKIIKHANVDIDNANPEKATTNRFYTNDSKQTTVNIIYVSAPNFEIPSSVFDENVVFDESSFNSDLEDNDVEGEMA
ncbi:MAG: type VI secretion system Vgr family protein [Aquirhabdus sp.]